jgi:L-alanine-DL-glutamate epimerase-like enolase superfamily enzyme
VIINQIAIYPLNIGLKHAIRVPLGVIESAQNVAIKLTTDSGLVGWGEASPFAPITGDSQATNLATAVQLAELVLGKPALALEARTAEINGFTVGEPSIRSAFDMALYDLAAKAADMPLYQFLGGEPRPLRTDLTIGLQDSGARNR